MNPRLIRILPVLAAVGAMALFTALGFWQLERAAFKSDLARDFAARDGSATVDVVDGAALAGLPRFKPVTVTGRFAPGRQIYLDNRVRDGRPGVEMYTPFRLEGGGTVLVNRGWLPMPARRRPLPAAPVPAGKITLRGLVNEPPATGVRLGDAPASPDWPWLTPYLTIAEAEEALGVSLSDAVILLGEAQPHGFLRDWRPPTLPAERHLGYAVQWFAMAAAIAAIWMVLAWRSRRAGESAR